jgi:hypothetical protein
MTQAPRPGGEDEAAELSLNFENVNVTIRGGGLLGLLGLCPRRSSGSSTASSSSQTPSDFSWVAPPSSGSGINLSQGGPPAPPVPAPAAVDPWAPPPTEPIRLYQSDLPLLNATQYQSIIEWPAGETSEENLRAFLEALSNASSVRGQRLDLRCYVVQRHPIAELTGIWVGKHPPLYGTMIASSGRGHNLAGSSMRVLRVVNLEAAKRAAREQGMDQPRIHLVL